MSMARIVGMEQTSAIKNSVRVFYFSPVPIYCAFMTFFAARNGNQQLRNTPSTNEHEHERTDLNSDSQFTRLRNENIIFCTLYLIHKVKKTLLIS